MKSERGFTVVEMAVAMFVAAIIAGSAGMTTAHIMKTSGESQDLITMTNQSHNLDFWLHRDILSAQSVNVTDDAGTGDIEFVLIFWSDWETGDTRDTRYIWLPSSDSLQKLQRKQITRNSGGATISSKTTLIADNICSANLTALDSRWKLTVETRSGSKSMTREYLIGQRQEH